MNILFAVIGIVVGGMMFHLAGAVSGGVLGWLLGGQHDLRKRHTALEKELATLRKRLDQEPHEEILESELEEIIEPPEFEFGYETVHPEAKKPEPVVFTAPAQKTTEEKQQPPRQQYVPHLEPVQPSAAEEWLRNLLSGENLLVKLGVLILFFGVSFLVKYAAQHGFFPIELRLTAAALGGCALLATGWKLREQRQVYAQVIQGGGVGILYLTTYATMHLYHLIPAGLGFVLLIAICALSAALSVIQDSRSLAVIGSVGGFLTPELAGIGSNNPAQLFGYYAILNSGILAIAYKRAWRELNLLGFIGTFIVSALWGSHFYRPDYFFSVEPFLVLFFLIYAALPVLYARKQPTVLDGYIDVTLVFGTPILSFAFQAALVRQYEYGLAWSALAAAIYYITMAGRLFRSEPERMRTMAEAFLALGTLFGTLAIPLALEGRWTSAAWSLEGAALVWVGLRYERSLARALGYLLLIGSGVMFIGDDGLRSGVWPVLNSSYIGTLLICGAALFTARLLGRSACQRLEYERYASPLLFAWGILWWLGGGLNEVTAHTQHNLTFGALLVFIAASSYTCNHLRERLDWQLLEWPALALLPAMSILAVPSLLDGRSYPSLQGGWFGWYMILSANRDRTPRLHHLTHAAPFWLLTLLVSWELSGRIAHHLPGMTTWAFCVWGAVPALMVLLIARRGATLPWPIDGNLSTYLGLGSAPLTLASFLWLLNANFTHSGNPWPLPYLPLINPLDGTTLLVLISLICWYRAIRGSLLDLAQHLPQREAILALTATLFLWLNAILLRFIHHWCGVPFTVHDLFSSLTVQTTLSICWCLLALTVMTQATRRGLRLIWMSGAGLLGAVVAKLFLVDLAGHGSIARIISFVVVGLLILLIGWFSPVPPRAVGGGV